MPNIRILNMSRCSILFTLVISLSAVCHADDKTLVGHWPLIKDISDHSASKVPTEGHDIQFVESQQRNKNVANLNGRSAYLSAKNHQNFNFGTKQFSLAAWVNTEENLNDVVGDVISKFDPQNRTGFELSIRHNVGVTDSPANQRQVHFGIDQGKLGQWVDRGRPGNNVYVFSLVTFNKNLYCSTCEPGENEAGHVYRFDGTSNWIDCGTPDKANAVSAMAVYQGQLYVASCRYRLRGSGLTESQNQHPGGKVFRYDGDKKWTDCGRLGEANDIFGMVVFNDKLYASSMYSPGLYRYDGGTTWVNCGSPDGKRVESLAVYNGAIYCSGFDEGAVYRYDGNNWEHLGVVDNNTQTYGFAVYQGGLFVSTWPSGKVYRHDGGTKWIDVGRLDEELESMPLVIYNGMMYCGSLPLAGVYRYDGDTKWTSLGRVDNTPDVKYRRAWSMAVYQGQLFVGALPSGRVKSIEAGKSATADIELRPGWRHLVAVRDEQALKLYIDGTQVATSTTFAPADYNVDNSLPLKIGFGQQDYFNGQLSDVRIYNKALSDGDVKQLFEQKP